MINQRNAVLLLSGVLSVYILTSYQNCSPVAFVPFSPSASSNNNPDGSSGTVGSIQQFQPAVASRDVSCLACHANIQANLITDFGYPDAWYLDGLQSPTSFGSAHYTATTWQTIEQISGQVVVPAAAMVPQTYAQAEFQSGAPPLTGPLNLVSYLTSTSVKDFGGNWYSYFGETTPTNTSFTYKVNSGTQAAVVSQSQIYIGAPTSQEILALAPSLNQTQGPWIQVVGASTTGLSGLTLSTGVNGQMYVTNNGSVKCSGLDVVINGTLLLNNLNVYAETGGCRFYVTGSVFIEGPITYLNSGSTTDPTDNLQVTSATSIIMGVGLNGSALNGDGTTDGPGQTPLNVRLISDVRSNMSFRSAPTSSAYTTYANSILAEGENIGVALLQDASVPAAGQTTALSAAKQPRVSIPFQHILLNAPMIHSRYMGTVTGVIVAESAMFSLGEFSFNFDPVFQNVPVLPALPYDILCTSSTCNPANP